MQPLLVSHSLQSVPRQPSLQEQTPGAGQCPRPPAWGGVRQGEHAFKEVIEGNQGVGSNPRSFCNSYLCVCNFEMNDLIND